MLATPKTQDKLHHVANAKMTGIHDVFHPDKYGKEDAISLKKILIKESVWETIKNVLGFEFDGNPGEYKKLKKWIREGYHIKKGISFEEFRTYIAKLRYAFINIPAGKGLLSPSKQMLGKEQNNPFPAGILMKAYLSCAR